jgi:XRE family transcriptional regulator, regulator of sulfur utilization
MTLGDKIRGIRTLKGLSQENMADLLDMSLRGYGDIERGTTDVPFSRLEQIAEKLGVQISDVLAYGDRVTNFFDQCNGNVNAGTNPTQNNNYDPREAQHQIEKLQLEFKLSQAQKDKAEMEARYWKQQATNQTSR